MMRLIFNSGPNAGTEIATSAALLRIGSDPQQSDIIINDPNAAQRHCLLQRSPRGLYVLEDLGSQQGTIVNGKVVQNLGRPTAIYLSAGDRFQVGSTEIEIGEGRARIMVTNGPRAGFEMPLDEHAVTIGRAPDNVLDFEEPDVSVYHAALLSLPGGFTIQDNGSTNGTFVNGHRVERHILTDGDIITIGNNDLRYLVEVTDSPRERQATNVAAQTSAVQLVFVAGPHQGMTIPIVDDQLTFGRRQGCTVVLDDMQASGMHCGITRVENELHVTDLGSTNGTVLNGVRLTETKRLNPGDLLEIGASVLELRVTGGIITEAGLTTAMTTVIAEGAYEATSQPKFVIDGHVESTHEITLGRSPASSILLDGRGVSSVHAVIKWEDGFYLEDKSTYGTYLNDRRVVREKLFTGHVIRVGEHLIDVQVRGERCTLDRIDRATAMAAIEVHREAQVDLAQAVPDQANSSAATGNAYKTVFNLQLPDVEAMIQERKAKFKEGAPAWRPSTDLDQGSVGKVAVLASLIASVAVGGILLGTAQADALINHPLSEAHASQAFVDQADELGIDSGCAACHSAGNGVPAGKCTSCHEGFDEVRAKHTGEGPGDGRTPPGSACVACHNEHRGLPRKNQHGMSTMLGAGGTCAAESCHPNQHSKDFVKTDAELPLELKAGPVPSFDLPQEEFHIAHAQVKQPGSDDKRVSVGCTACHAAKKDGALIEGSAGKSCFRCHEGGEEHVNSQCSSCHRDEHGAAELVQLPDDDDKIAAAVTSPSSGRSLLVGGALALVAFLPLAGLALILRLRRRQRALQVVAHIHQFPVQTVKRLVHSINTDKCVGCSMCVQACPASVLELVNHKSTIVNFDACIQCKKCEAACAFDALRMHDADKPPPMIKMPDVDNYYETSVKGMYLIGQASGTPQVKNAINLGRAVISHMTRMGGCAPGSGHRVGASCDVIIVGSGPAGLSAAASAARAGLSYMLLEKQRAFSWTIRSFYHKGKPVMAEPNDVEMMGDIAHWDTVREDLLNSWEQSIQQYGIQIQYQADVTDVKKNGEIFTVVVSDPKGNPLTSYTAARVVLAIGTMGNPRKLGCPGDDHEKVANALVDPDEYRGKNVLVVGGTDSAIEVVLALCETNRVWMSVRSAKFDRVKPKNLEKIEKVIAEGKCTALFATVMKEVTDTTCTLEYKADKRSEQIPNDAVFAMIGGHPPTKFLEGIGVPYVEKPHSWSPPRTDELVKMTGA